MCKSIVMLIAMAYAALLSSELPELKDNTPIGNRQINSTKSTRVKFSAQKPEDIYSKNVAFPGEDLERVIHARQDESIIQKQESRDTDVMVTDRHKPNGHPVVARYGSWIYVACEGIYNGYPCIDVYRTANSGQSWQFITGWYYSSTTYEAYFPSIAVTSSYVVVTYDRRENGALGTIRCARIPLGGTSANFYTVDEPDRGTSDIVAYNNIVYCVYRYTYSSTDWDIEFSRSTNSGATWSSRVTVAGLWPISLPLDMPKICAVTSNILVTTWHHWSSGTYRVDWSKSANGGSSWSSSEMFTAQLCHPDVTGYQNTYLITCQSYPSNILAYVYTFDGGNSWSFHTRLSGSYYAQCTYGNGLYRSAYTRNNRVYYSSAVSPQQLGDGGAITDQPTALNDAIGLTTFPSSLSLCLWKDSRNSTSIYSDYCEEGIEEQSKLIVTEFGLKQNYPNPISEKTMIKYTLAEACEVKLVIFDASGREITVLVDDQQEAGTHETNWNISNTSNQYLPNGVYFCYLRGGDLRDVSKMIITR